MERALVTYASKNGSTAEIAAVIADELRDAGIDTDLIEAAYVDDVAPYTTVVLGSAVYMAHWRPEARHFAKRYRKRLAERTVWLFSSGPVGDVDTEDERWSVPKFVRRLVGQIGVREHVVFGGRVPLEPSNFIERSMLEKTPEALRDLRDWDEIREWARKVAAPMREHSLVA
jgi:menaquinone-dependent protoporphyrinogen oxidase